MVFILEAAVTLQPQQTGGQGGETTSAGGNNSAPSATGLVNGSRANDDSSNASDTAYSGSPNATQGSDNNSTDESQASSSNDTPETSNGGSSSSGTNVVNGSSPDAGIVLINEVEANPSGSDYASSEWVELYNPTATSVDVTGWSVRSTAGGRTGSAALSGTIGPGQYLVVTFPSQFLDNSAESAILADKAGRVIDQTPSQNDELNNEKTWQRAPDGGNSWVFQTGTKGTSNLVAPAPGSDSGPPLVDAPVSNPVNPPSNEQTGSNPVNPPVNEPAAPPAVEPTAVPPAVDPNASAGNNSSS